MHAVFNMALIILVITAILLALAAILGMKTFSDREKNSPFECGFDPKSSARSPFSLQFFLIATIFLVFDVEITLILPLAIIMTKTNLINFFMISVIFITVLLLGLYHEWKQGALTWAH
uniref:NADH-ubiquinone oxidoreductase chain 3 n=1 Tax=Acmaeodera sp. NCS-2009 TaxID=590154 RepID=D1G5M8_9COLE|nr:NADH dehydrogenase subunit 3 [Acmaeodera sp. NCS-2009]ACM45043.1 NADH dehydrogenase subunit 3 [Acmaeodera sp. NCS-2009]